MLLVECMQCAWVGVGGDWCVVEMADDYEPDYEVLELQFRPDLLEPAAHLLNGQWPRSLEAR